MTDKGQYIKHWGVFIIYMMQSLFLFSSVPSTEGKVFWLTFMNNINEVTYTQSNKFKISLRISSQYDVNVHISNPADPSLDMDLFLPAYDTREISIPLKMAYTYSHNTIENRGICVRADTTISLFAYNYRSNSYDATVVLPESGLGCHYVVQVNETYSSSFHREVAIVATEDNTEISINPKSKIRDMMEKGEFSIRLDRGQTYLMMVDTNSGDFSGSTVDSDKPIAVFTGHQCTEIDNSKFCDHLYEQLMPTFMWGRRFVIVRTVGEPKNKVHVTSLNDGTNLSINNTLVRTLNANESYVFYLTDDVCYLESDQPVQCFLYLMSARENSRDNKMGDPSVVHITPLEQNINRLTFTLFNTQTTTHYINIVSTRSDCGNLRLTYSDDTRNIIRSEDFKSVIGNEEYVYQTIELGNGKLGMYTIQGGVDGCNGYVYGVANVESYAYSFGSATYNLQAKILVNGTFHDDTLYDDGWCYQRSVEFSPSYIIRRTVNDTVIWDFGDGTVVEEESVRHLFPHAGDYRVRMVVKNEITSDTAYTTLRLRDVVKDTIRVAICSNEEYIFRGERYNSSGVRDIVVTTPNECDSLITLDISTIEAKHVLLRETICHDGSYFFNGVEYTVGCSVNETTSLANGCDSITTLELFVLPAPTRYTNVVSNIPRNSVYSWQTGKYSESGTYYDTIRTRGKPLCDSIIYQLDLSFADETSLLRDTTCETEQSFKDFSYTIPELPDDVYSEDVSYFTYVLEYRDSSACTVEYIYVTRPVFSNHSYYDTVQIGEPYVFYGEEFRIQGNYTDTIVKKIQKGYRCPYTYDTLFLTGVSYPIIKTRDRFCYLNEVIQWRGKSITTSGTYYDTVENSAGIDSVFQLLVEDPRDTIIYSAQNVPNRFIWAVNKVTYTESGTYYDTTRSMDGCDSILHILRLGINEKYVIHIEESKSICEGDTFSWRNKLCYQTKDYTDTVKTISNAVCDSIFVLHLTVYTPPEPTDLTIQICRGDYYFYHGSKLYDEKTYHYIFPTQRGCDSIVNLSLVYKEAKYREDTVYIQEGQIYQWGNTSYVEPGTYRKIFVSKETQCDSVVDRTLLALIPYTTPTVSATICAGDVYMWRNKPYNETGLYRDSSSCIEGVGCDSLFSLDLFVADPYFPTISEYDAPDRDLYYDEEYICQGKTVTWHGNIYSKDSFYVDTIPSSYRCDSVVGLRLHVYPTFDSIQYATICQNDYYLWENDTCRDATIYTKSYQSCHQCDSIMRLQLIVHPSYEQVFKQEICNGDSVFWGGEWRKSSGNFEDKKKTLLGCDSNLYLSLTTYPSYDSVVYVNLCEGDSFVIGDKEYFLSGHYKDTLMSQYSCDSIVTLHLSVSPIYHIDRYDTIVEGDIIHFNGKVYSTSGVYLLSSKSVDNCDSLITLYLHVVDYQWKVTTDKQCADDPFVYFYVENSGEPISQFRIDFSEKARKQYFHDTIVTFDSSNPIIEIPNRARAGIYSYKMGPSGVRSSNSLITDSFTLLYPSYVIDQHWDDFIAVLNSKYNGGYEFVAFQWYRENRPIYGETRSQLYSPLEMGKKYSVLLRESDGTQLMSCPIIAQHVTEISLYPTILTSQQSVYIGSSGIHSDMVVEIYTLTGTRVYTRKLNSDATSFPSPKQPGVYIVKIIQSQGSVIIKRIIVQ